MVNWWKSRQWPCGRTRLNSVPIDCRASPDHGDDLIVGPCDVRNGWKVVLNVTFCPSSQRKLGSHFSCARSLPMRGGWTYIMINRPLDQARCAHSRTMLGHIRHDQGRTPGLRRLQCRFPDEQLQPEARGPGPHCVDEFRPEGRDARISVEIPELGPRAAGKKKRDARVTLDRPSVRYRAPYNPD